MWKTRLRIQFWNSIWISLKTLNIGRSNDETGFESREEEEEQVDVVERFDPDGRRWLAVGRQRTAHRITCSYFGTHREHSLPSIPLHRLRHWLGFRRIFQVNNSSIILYHIIIAVALESCFTFAVALESLKYSRNSWETLNESIKTITYIHKSRWLEDITHNAKLIVEESLSIPVSYRYYSASVKIRICCLVTTFPVTKWMTHYQSIAMKRNWYCTQLS